MEWAGMKRAIFSVTETPSGNIYGVHLRFRCRSGAQSPIDAFSSQSRANQSQTGSMDHQGCLWIALWGGGKALRVSPVGKIKSLETF